MTLTATQLPAKTGMAHTQEGWRFWAAWVAAFIGFPLAGLAASAVVGAVDTPLDGALAGAVAGAVIGLAQWVVLRRRVSLLVGWVIATAAGMGVGLSVSITLLGIDATGLALLVRGLVTGASIGLVQWVLLRQVGRRAVIWPPVVAVAWALGWFVTRAAGVDLEPNWAVFGATGALSFQVATGLALAWLLRRGPGVNAISVPPLA